MFPTEVPEKVSVGQWGGVVKGFSLIQVGIKPGVELFGGEGEDSFVFFLKIIKKSPGFDSRQSGRLDWDGFQETSGQIGRVGNPSLWLF